MRDFVYSLRVRKRTLYFVVLHRVNFTIFLVGVMWYGIVVGIDGEVLEGKLPNKQMKLLLAWMAIHEEELNANWQLLSHGDGCFKIEPLR